MGFIEFTDRFRKLIGRKDFYILLSIAAFMVGLIIPSPFFNHGLKGYISRSDEILTDTTNMKLPDGSVYEGTIISNTKERHGYGKLTMEDGTTYEGEWKQDRLPYGSRTSESSKYNGHFDEQLNIDGFGIIDYTEQYIKGKREQGLEDVNITKQYIGNWRKNNKQDASSG